MSRRVLRIVAMALLAASESGATASAVPIMALLSSLLLLFVVAGTGTVVVVGGGSGGGNAATLVVIEASRERSMMKLPLPLPVVEMASVAAVLVADCIMQILLIEEFDDRRHHDVRIGVPAKNSLSQLVEGPSKICIEEYVLASVSSL